MTYISKIILKFVDTKSYLFEKLDGNKTINFL